MRSAASGVAGGRQAAAAGSGRGVPTPGLSVATNRIQTAFASHALPRKAGERPQGSRASGHRAGQACKPAARHFNAGICDCKTLLHNGPAPVAAGGRARLELGAGRNLAAPAGVVQMQRTGRLNYAGLPSGKPCVSIADVSFHRRHRQCAPRIASLQSRVASTRSGAPQALRRACPMRASAVLLLQRTGLSLAPRARSLASAQPVTATAAAEVAAAGPSGWTAASAASAGASLTDRYHQLVAAGTLQHDPAQEHCVRRLDRLGAELKASQGLPAACPVAHANRRCCACMAGT